MNLNGVSAAAVQTSFHFHCLSFERGRYRGLDPDAGSIHPPELEPQLDWWSAATDDSSESFESVNAHTLW
jgi:hypothetical protein